MTQSYQGGCLCRAVRFTASGDPVRVTICHCTFCQKITGSAFLVEPIFLREDITLSGEAPGRFEHHSDSSGKRVTVNFCRTCGTSLFLDLERFPDVIGLFGGTFDDPNWFDRASPTSRHIFTRSAQRGVVIPAGVAVFDEHAIAQDGTPMAPTVHEYPVTVTRR